MEKWNLNEKDLVTLLGPITAKGLQDLKCYSHIDKLSIKSSVKNQELITDKIAIGFKSLKSVKWLWLCCQTTKTAMNHAISIPNLETMDVLDVCKPGRLKGFSQAKSLKVLRCGWMSKKDLVEVSKIPKLEELGAQNCKINKKALYELLEMKHLTKLDLEGSNFNDELAKIISSSKRIEQLEIGSSKLTSVGLQSICMMKQLKSLDIWNIDASDKQLA
jgi:hypothetical protein